MASYCPNPNCNYKLSLKDWKPTCPKCGTNILYYKMEERLLAEADVVEVANAKFSRKSDRLKAAVVGDKWAIARLVLLFLPLGMLFLPLASVVTTIPFVSDKAVTLNAISIFSSISGLNFDMVFDMLGQPAFSKAFIWFLLAVVAFVLIVLAILLGLAFSVLACSPKGFPRAILVFVLGAGGTALSAVGLLQYSKLLALQLPGVFTASLSFGTYLVGAAFLIGLGINIFIKAKGGIPVAHKTCYISGFKEDEVWAAFDKGLTLADMRRMRDEEEAAKAAREEAAEAQEADAVPEA